MGAKMNRKVRVIHINNEKMLKIQVENNGIRDYLRNLERDSLRRIILNANSVKSEGKLGKEINFSDI